MLAINREKTPKTISAEQAAALVKPGMWLDYGGTLCQPDVFDKALAARIGIGRAPAHQRHRRAIAVRARGLDFPYRNIANGELR